MSESRLQNSLSHGQEEQKISDNQSYSEDQLQPNKTSSKPLGRPRGRGRPKLIVKPNNKKKESPQQIDEEPPKTKQKATANKQENQIEGYIKIVDFLKKIQCDEISFQNKMNPYHSLTATSFWYMISAQYFSYDFFARKNPSEAAYNILNRVSKLPVQIPTRFIKNTHLNQPLQFETEQVRAYSLNISQYLSQMIPAPSSINRSENIEKKVSLTTVAQDNEFIASTRALLFNYVKGKLQKSDKWSTNIKPKLQKIQNLQPKQYIKSSSVYFQQEKQEIIDYDQLDILSRQAKKKKSQKKKSQRQSKSILEVNEEDQQKQGNQNNQQIINEAMQIEQNHKQKYQNQHISSKQQLHNNIQNQMNLQHKSHQIEQQHSDQNTMDRRLTRQMTSDQVLLSSLLQLPLQKVISILQSTLHSNYNLPNIQPAFMSIPKNDPLQLVFQLHQQQQKYLQYMKQYKKKQYRIKHKNQHIIEQEQRQTQFQDAKCQICTDGDYTDDNLIVFCSKCNISLHQRCVGLAKVPAQSWVCDVCLAFGPGGINVPCPMCNVKGGALKRTNIHIDNPMFKQLNPAYFEYAKKCPYNKQKQQYQQIQTQKQQNIQQNQIDPQKSRQQKDQLYYDYFNKTTYPTNQPSCHYVWVHYVCAIWVPECYFEQKNGAINIKGIQNIDKRRFKHQCTVCKKVKSGACVKCDDPQCRKYYHPECARKKKVYMEQLNLQKIKYLIFCEEHQPLKITRQIQYKKKKNRDEIIKFARMIQKYVQTYKIAYFPFKLMKIIPTKSFIQTFQKDEKLQQIQLKQQVKKQTDEQFTKDIIIKLSKVKKITVTVIKTQTGFKICEMNQPSRRQMRKCLNRYDDFWHSIKNNQSAQENWKRYQRIIKQNSFLKQKMEIFLNGQSLAGPAHLKGSNKNKKGKARGKNAKQQQQQTLIQQEGGIFCICRKPYENELDMIQCQICSQWYHFKCIGFIGTQQDAQSLQFHCMKCMKFQTQEQKRPRLQKCIRFFATDSLFLNYRPPTPILMSEEDPQQVRQSLILQSEQKYNLQIINPQKNQKADLKQNTQMNRPKINPQKLVEQQEINNFSNIKLKAKSSNKSDRSQNSIKSDKQKTVSKTNSNIPTPMSLQNQKMQTTLTQFFVGISKKQKQTVQQKLAKLQKSVQDRQYNNIN